MVFLIFLLTLRGPTSVKFRGGLFFAARFLDQSSPTNYSTHFEHCRIRNSRDLIRNEMTTCKKNGKLKSWKMSFFTTTIITFYMFQLIFVQIVADTNKI